MFNKVLSTGLDYVFDTNLDNNKGLKGFFILNRDVLDIVANAL